MTKIHPSSQAASSLPECVSSESEPISLTVWLKSLLFNCSGFTVFDSNGNLTFRVDKYSSRSRAKILLMDSAGKPLFTIRRKKLSIAGHWHIYEGESTASSRFSVRKHLTLLSSKELARVTNSSRSGGEVRDFYSVEGSFSQRSCVIYDGSRRLMAEIRRKDMVAGVPFNGDVFRLIVQPCFDPGLAMAVVILLEQMFGSSVASVLKE